MKVLITTSTGKLFLFTLFQDRGFKLFAENMIKLSLNKTKSTNLLARTRFSFFRFGFEYLFLGPKSQPEKFPGLSRNGPLARVTFVPARLHPASVPWLCYHQNYHNGTRFILIVAPERELYLGTQLCNCIM